MTEPVGEPVTERVSPERLMALRLYNYDDSQEIEWTSGGGRWDKCSLNELTDDLRDCRARLLQAETLLRRAESWLPKRLDDRCDEVRDGIDAFLAARPASPQEAAPSRLAHEARVIRESYGDFGDAAQASTPEEKLAATTASVNDSASGAPESVSVPDGTEPPALRSLIAEVLDSEDCGEEPPTRATVLLRHLLHEADKLIARAAAAPPLVPDEEPTTLYDELTAVLFDVYVRATEGQPADRDAFSMYEPEDQGVVLRSVEAALKKLVRETHLEKEIEAAVRARRLLGAPNASGPPTEKR